MSNDERDESEFDDFDLPDEGVPPEEEIGSVEDAADASTAQPGDNRGGFADLRGLRRDKRRGAEKEGLLPKLRRLSPYTVMLGISLAAVLLAILLLFLELASYNFDIKAKEAEQRVGAAVQIQSAWPSRIVAT